MSSHAHLLRDECWPLLAPAQVYAQNRYSSSPQGRWLARGVDILLHQYPSLRVAFIDTFKGGGARGWQAARRRAHNPPAASCVHGMPAQPQKRF